jgi:hypothetical protein
MTTLMWEVRAADGRTDDLLTWVLAHADAAAEVYCSADGRVVVVDRNGTALPDVPPELVTRQPHAWRFEPVAR